MTELLDLLQAHAANAIDQYDSRNPNHDHCVCEMADRLVDGVAGMDQLERWEQTAAEDFPLSVQIAMKLARSKWCVRQIVPPLHVSVVYAVYQEHTRILRPDQHPHGEDFVARKIDQVNWLFGDSKTLSWDMFIVDDGCPDRSGQMAQQVLQQRFPQSPVEVLFLEEAIRENLPIVQPMTSSRDSQKGGSIIYGLWKSVQQEQRHHITMYTDADLSTHLGQIGLLADGIVNAGRDAAIGSRREPTSVVVKQGHRNTRGKLFIYLWKSMIAPLGYLTDTQCGFKAFTAETVRAIISDLMERRFAFDIELLMKTELRRRDSIIKVPIAWIDSEAASTTTGIQPYLPMLQSAAAMYRHYLQPDSDADEFATLIESLTEEQWQRMAERVPPQIADADPASFACKRPVTASQLRRLV